jgi:hypothetical protein
MNHAMSAFRFVILAVALACIPSGAAAQVYLGAIGGINRADLEVDVESPFDIDPFESRSMPAIGGVVEFELMDHLSLRLEPMYIRKGARIDLPVFDIVTLSGKADLEYFEVPIHVNVAILGGPVQPYLLAGPSIGLLYEARVVNNLVGEEDIEEQLKLPDLSIDLGGGVNIDIGRLRLFGEARYSHGLPEISEEVEGVEIALKTRGVQLLGGLAVRFGG